MAYNINHRKHATEYLKQHTAGTTSQIVKALPKAKRTPAVYSTMNQCLGRMLGEGTLRRVAPGCYALATEQITPIDALCKMDECYCYILGLLEKPSMSMSAVSVKDIYEALALKGFSKIHTHKKLRNLENIGVLAKKKHFGHGPYYWSIKQVGFDPAEWRTTADGTGFKPPRAIAVPLRKSKTPRANGIAGESVPAFNILRKRGTQRDPATVTIPTPQTQQAAEPEEFTIPRPSIFD
jgi:hypothetical protein